MLKRLLPATLITALLVVPVLFSTALGAPPKALKDLGNLRQREILPDGTEVWIPQADSPLAGRIELRLRDGRLVEQRVLRPTPISVRKMSPNSWQKSIRQITAQPGGKDSEFEGLYKYALPAADNNE